ncbi:hypothetical protein CERSUDRAFT_112014 [Gelatoporia subvermispora B]|uniref:Uncharacterized protein n=1 Tax=Ceriporiopsis subvermispora (strain B) TaxID=914234 RepID=M2PSQ7_CERS8|nr:hypothetical protein CERSUDRAFT_112014 [Gelatoporia subvermispora B]
MSVIKELARIINEGVNTIQSKCDASGKPFPSLDEPYTPESDAVRIQVIADALPIIAAANQLIATLQIPAMSIIVASGYVHVSAAFATIAKANVVEALREAGPQGLHVKEIVEKIKKPMDPAKLARMLRICATYHIFREVAPDVFTNNRISSLLDKGKPLKEILAKPLEAFDESPGCAAFVDILIDESFKAAAVTQDHLMDPSTAFSDEPNQLPIQRAMHTNKALFEWYDEPGNELRRRRFNIAMKESVKFEVPGAILQGFDWGALPKGSKVVDVGGGIGGTTMALYDIHKHLRYVIQDREAVIKQAQQVWQTERPEALENDTLALQPHNFFEKQPVKDASVFLLRTVIHDWSDRYARTILTHLRAAAAPYTQLVLVDQVAPLACSEDGISDVPGATAPTAPPPLLPNFGLAGSMVYNLDIQMILLCGGEERTVLKISQLLSSAGWKLQRIARVPGNLLHKIIATPA